MRGLSAYSRLNTSAATKLRARSRGGSSCANAAEAKANTAMAATQRINMDVPRVGDTLARRRCARKRRSPVWRRLCDHSARLLLRQARPRCGRGFFRCLQHARQCGGVVPAARSHDAGGGPQRAQVRLRIGGKQQEVGARALGDDAEFALLVQEAGGVERGDAEDFDVAETRHFEEAELFVDGEAV